MRYEIFKSFWFRDPLCALNLGSRALLSVDWTNSQIKEVCGWKNQREGRAGVELNKDRSQHDFGNKTSLLIIWRDMLDLCTVWMKSSGLIRSSPSPPPLMQTLHMQTVVASLGPFAGNVKMSDSNWKRTEHWQRGTPSVTGSSFLLLTWS